MAKYDAVDRLMKMATEETPAAKGAGRGRPMVAPPDAERDAEGVLEAKIVAREPVATGVVITPPAPPMPPADDPASSSLDRGRQLLGALRPFLPAVGSALRLVDHGAVQAVARLLPMLGNLGGSAPQASPVDARDRMAEALAASEKRYTAMGAELNEYKGRVEGVEEGQRRLRELLERSVAEQGSLTHTLHQLADRSRLLSATVIILVMLVVAELVLLTITLHR